MAIPKESRSEIFFSSPTAQRLKVGVKCETGHATNADMPGKHLAIADAGAWAAPVGGPSVVEGSKQLSCLLPTLDCVGGASPPAPALPASDETPGRAADETPENTTAGTFERALAKLHPWLKGSTHDPHAAKAPLASMGRSQTHIPS